MLLLLMHCCQRNRHNLIKFVSSIYLYICSFFNAVNSLPLLKVFPDCSTNYSEKYVNIFHYYCVYVYLSLSINIFLLNTSGTPTEQNYLLEGRPCSIGFLCYVSVLGTHLCQCTNWHYCKRLHSASVILFKTLSKCLPISWWVIYECTCPLHDRQFWTKNNMTPMLHPPYSL